MKFVIVLAAALIVLVMAFWILGWYSSRVAPTAMTAENILQCGNKPNCVSSEGVSNPSQAVKPIVVSGSDPIADVVSAAIAATGGQLVSVDPSTIVATYQSSMFRFIDDVIIKIDPSSPRRIDIMSSSRVGYSDFNANRQRVERLRAILTASEI